jgi:hypothetical protein
LRAIVYRQAQVKARHVRVYRSLGDGETIGDFLLCVTEEKKAHDLKFAFGDPQPMSGR